MASLTHTAGPVRSVRVIVTFPVKWCKFKGLGPVDCLPIVVTIDLSNLYEKSRGTLKISEYLLKHVFRDRVLEKLRKEGGKNLGINEKPDPDTNYGIRCVLPEDIEKPHIVVDIDGQKTEVTNVRWKFPT